LTPTVKLSKPKQVVTLFPTQYTYYFFQTLIMNRAMNMRFRYKTYVSNAWELKQEEGIKHM